MKTNYNNRQITPEEIANRMADIKLNGTKSKWYRWHVREMQALKVKQQIKTR